MKTRHQTVPSPLSIFLLIFTVCVGSIMAGENPGSPEYAQPLPTPTAADERAARTSFKKLVDLQAALRKIPRERHNREPHKTFLRVNRDHIVYSEPAADHYVRSELFWDLHSRYMHVSFAEEIAWTAAQNPLPGECEGYVNCVLYVVNSTDAKYLRLYPKGKYSKKALQNVIGHLSPMADPLDKENYTGPIDESDKAELKQVIEELRMSFEYVSEPERTTALRLVKQIRENFN